MDQDESRQRLYKIIINADLQGLSRYESVPLHGSRVLQNPVEGDQRHRCLLLHGKDIIMLEKKALPWKVKFSLVGKLEKLCCQLQLSPLSQNINLNDNGVSSYTWFVALC